MIGRFKTTSTGGMLLSIVWVGLPATPVQADDAAMASLKAENARLRVRVIEVNQYERENWMGA